MTEPEPPAEPGDSEPDDPGGIEPITDPVERVVGLLERTRCGEPAIDSTAVVVAVQEITALAKAYTRGRGFTDSGPHPDISAAIVTAAARLVSNPRQIPVEFPAGPGGSTRVFRGGFTGWSLAELAALNRYRVRAQ